MINTDTFDLLANVMSSVDRRNFGCAIYIDITKPLDVQSMIKLWGAAI